MFVLGDALVAPGWRYLALAGLIAFGCISYACAGHVFGAFRAAELKAMLRRGRS